jgi:RNA polymerase sigma-70 factor (ECF subfamily)
MADSLINQYINEWVGGEERAFKKVFDYYLPKLSSTAFRSVKKREESEELALNVMLSIWQYKLHIHTINDFEDYLYGILRNQISRYSRKKLLLTEALESVPLDNLGTVDHPEFSIRELQLRYETALKKLPPKQREIFLLSREQGMSQKQIAEEKDISVHTVNNHITTSLKFLRKEFQDYPEALPVILLIGTAVIR